MAYVAAFAAIAGMAMQIKAANDEAEAKQTAAQYNRERDLENASLAQQEGDEEARRAGIVAGKVQGQNRAAIGASGIQMTGSALDVLNENASTAELDRLGILHSADLKRRNYVREANMEAFKGTTALQNRDNQTAGAVIGGTAKAYNYASYGGKGGDGYTGGSD